MFYLEVATKRQPSVKYVLLNSFYIDKLCNCTNLPGNIKAMYLFEL